MQRPVMVIDDDQDVCESTADLLRQAGYTVTCCDSGDDALARLHAGLRPAVIMVDYKMAAMNGAEFLHACRADEALARIPTVLVSGFARDSVAQLAGASAFLRKPFQVGELLEVVRRLA
jgi:CheY-like chemotaxis protein